MLDPVLPEENDTYSPLDDANIRNHAPAETDGQPRQVATSQHESTGSQESEKPHDSDADLLEFNDFMRQLKESSAEKDLR
jgi:hypothetical protein